MRRRKHLHLPAEGKEEAIDPGILRIPNGHGQRTVLFPPDILPAEAVEHPVGRRGGEAQGQGGNGGGRRGGFQRRRAVGAGRKGFLQPLGAADAGEPEGAPGLAGTALGLQVPASALEVQADGFNYPFALFASGVIIGQVNEAGGQNGGLQDVESFLLRRIAAPGGKIHLDP